MENDTLLFYPSPNSQKVVILLEELGIPWHRHYIDLARGDQLTPEYLALNPNNKVPVWYAGPGRVLFESGAILEYLAEAHGRFLGSGDQRWQVKQWLYWQMAGFGPMAGQAHHFRAFAPEQVPYAIRRYTDEMNRLYGVLDGQLGDRDWVAGDYSIADMAIWPWAVTFERQGQRLSDFPQVERWFNAMAARPAVQRAVAICSEQLIAPEDYGVLLNQNASSVKRGPQ